MSLLTLKKYKNFVFPLIITIILSMIYNKYKSSAYDDENMNNYKIVKQYLLNDSSLAQSSKPIIWVHIVYEKNGRWWPSFGSRTTEDLNQPYQYLTLKSIIDKCGDDFNVCLIDDETFQNIIPGWNVDLSIVADPFINKIKDNYHESKKRFVTRKMDYIKFVTVIRQIANSIDIHYTNELSYDKSKYEIVYYFYKQQKIL